jgi:hypothetical protein
MALDLFWNLLDRACLFSNNPPYTVDVFLEPLSSLFHPLPVSDVDMPPNSRESSHLPAYSDMYLFFHFLPYINLSLIFIMILFFLILKKILLSASMSMITVPKFLYYDPVWGWGDDSIL